LHQCFVTANEDKVSHVTRIEEQGAERQEEEGSEAGTSPDIRHTLSAQGAQGTGREIQVTSQDIRHTLSAQGAQ